MRNKHFIVRVSEQELAQIKLNGGKNVGGWARSVLLKANKKTIVGHIGNYPVVEGEVEESKEIEDPGPLLYRIKCCACYSYETKPYDRNGKTFYLCDTHKP